MLSETEKNRNKKGFTLVELIVVLAIIAVLSAIAVPVLFTRSGYIDKGQVYAKAFYFDMQDLMLELKEEIAAQPTANTYYLFEVHYNDKAESKDNVSVSLYKGEVSGLMVTNLTPATLSLKVSDGADLKQRIFNRVTPTDAETAGGGFLYALVDSKFRVDKTYWSEKSFLSIQGNSTFTEDYYLTHNDGTNDIKFVTVSYPLNQDLLSEHSDFLKPMNP